MTASRYSVRIWAEAVEVAGYQSKVTAPSAFEAIRQELDYLAESDPAGVTETHYGLVITAEPIE